jgi:XTP/dITP diphosphohydrolase
MSIIVSVPHSLESCMRALLIATTNRHKLEELRAIFSNLPYQLFSLSDAQIDFDVEETGTTFQANSELKALAYARASGKLSLADDSGLEIDALGGVPGVYSARFAGVDTPYEERFRLLYERLRDIPPEQWTARFRCVMTIAEPSGYAQSVEGTLEGRIATAPCGTHGFGYDPIFFVPEYGMTSAELAPEVKNRISHRAQAAQRARVLLENWPQERDVRKA